MAYVVLARRFRPQTFAEVVGQEHVSATLRNAVRDGRLAHAYLFSGPRGVGKTSMARILAKALNCRQADAPTPEPCGRCDSCLEIAEGRSLDVVEMDAASHTGVDDVRVLREGALYAAARDRFKVYIIDEAHMMSRSAFNALLKVLEEPPAHVKFVFATTEPERLPDTIVSRCQRFDFRRISTAAALKRLEQIAASEKLRVDPQALELVARRSRGGLRDAEGLLDQLVAFRGQERIGAADVMEMAGAVSEAQVAGLLGALAESRAGDALAAMAGCLDAGAELDEVASALADRLRGALLTALAGRDSALVSGEYAHLAEELAAEAARSGPEKLLRMSAVLAEARRAMRASPEPRIVLELALVRMARLADLVDLRAVLDRLESAPAAPAASHTARPAAAAPAPAPAPAPAARRGPPARSVGEVSPFSDEESAAPPPAAPHAEAPESLPADPSAAWAAFRAAVREAHPPTDMLLDSCRLAGLSAERLQLGLPAGSFFQQEQLESPEKRRILEAAAERAFGRKLRVVCAAPSGGAAPAAGPAAPRPAPAGPAGHPDPAVQKLISRFDGRVVRVGKKK
jgi:DNA polymerase-3 subunit gamma/tau